MEKKKIEMEALYRLCNRERMFTCGSCSQYEKMFELAGNGITQMELAFILYLASDYRLDTIFNLVGPLFKNGGGL